MIVGQRRPPRLRLAFELLLCRFLDAGMTRRASHSGGRRPKSAKARSRGKFGVGSEGYGDFIFAPAMMVA